MRRVTRYRAPFFITGGARWHSRGYPCGRFERYSVLKFEAGLSDRKIAAAIGSARSTVRECLHRARAAGLPWPLAEGLDEAALHEKLYRREAPLARRSLPDFARLQAELKRPGVK